ncbi:hypothetical protein [Trueperella bialowiezensis]|uniref:Uncharacterized protein n=1 Tax=Trueperella bialowiezensis TaxID=312285 RepID=A0A448PEX2_9ACTO|nr:hypothetical protein [Trueperella bialowiezensis]VEI13444.1 Uncharacterised protein [Trueperella bialowiezensis]
MAEPNAGQPGGRGGRGGQPGDDQPGDGRTGNERQHAKPGRDPYSHLGEQLDVGPSDRRAFQHRVRANAGLLGMMALGLSAIILGCVMLAIAL